LTYTPTTWVDGSTSANAAHLNNIENGLVAVSKDVTFNASLTGTGVTSSGGFLVVPYDTVIENVGGGTWDAVNYTWACPVAGVYVITGLIRSVDNITPGVNVMNGVGLATADDANQVIQQFDANIGTRLTSEVVRVMRLGIGDLVRHYIYSVGGTFTYHPGGDGARFTIHLMTAT
jgi:hypothetical protein